MRILSWNLFHGRAEPAAGRPLLFEFATTLAGWQWDVALLQEVPPWWPPLLARAAGAQPYRVLTSRNWCPPAQRAIAARNPDLLKSWGGGCNAILVRGGAGAHRTVRLTRRPEPRSAHGVALAGGAWVVNLHVTTDPKARTRADIAGALAAAEVWSAGAPLVIGGDFNLTQPELPGFAHVARHHVDHVFVRGLEPAGEQELLDAGTLSDHPPLAVELL